MNGSRSSTLWRLAPFLIVLLTVVPLGVPYLQPGYQFADDRFAPYLRVEALRSAIAHGQFPPRWFAEFDGGYGSPYPSFYAMAFYAVAAAFNAVGVSVGGAVELTAFLAIAAAALAMFVLVRNLWGARSGVLAAALYAYAPYHLVDAFVRGALSELAAFVWFPLVVYATYQAILTQKRGWLVMSGLSIGGLMLTHNLMPIIFLPVIIALMGAIAVVREGSLGSKAKGAAMVGVSAALGLLVSAFFWLPIVFERSLLRLEYFLQYDYHGDFIGRRTLFAWASSEPPYTSIGLILVGAALVGSLIAFWPKSKLTHKAIVGSMLGAGAFFLFMTTRRSVWIWEHVPLLSFVQFPWRFLAPASFSLALAAAPIPRALRNGLASSTIVVVLGVSIYLQSKPLIGIADRIEGTTIESMPICQEVWGTQDYRPATSHTLFWRGPEPPADPGGALVLQPCRGIIDVLSQGEVQLRSSARRGTRWDVQYSAQAPAVVTIPQFFFPGWAAWVDGVAVSAGPSPGNGLLQVALPAGAHSLELDYRNTLVRGVGNGLSLLGLAALAAMAWSGRARAHRERSDRN